jgi:VanZ family protein
MVWLLLLAWFSTDAFSAEHTGGILLKIIRAIYGAIPQHNLDEINFLVRKSAHFSGYGLLSALAFFSWRATFPSARPWSFRWFFLALALTLTAASLDEFHQSFVPSRTSSPWDVALDMVGALGFQFVIALWIRSRRNVAS